MSQKLSIPAVDGYQLAASCFDPDDPKGTTLIIGGATGVLQRYYSRFATFMAENGIRVYTFDYRGIGKSKPKTLKGFPAKMQDWGELDIRGALKHVQAQHPNDTLHFVGHSAGGQVFGLVEENHLFDKVVLVASQSGNWRFWTGPGKLQMWTTSHVLIPLLTATVGYFPAKKLGLFEDLPKGVANQWAAWIRHPEYLFSSELPTLENFAGVKGSLRSYSFSDDGYAPEKTVDWLASKYENAQVERIHHKPADIGVKQIGHFGFFQPAFQKPYWEKVLEFLNS